MIDGFNFITDDVREYLYGAKQKKSNGRIRAKHCVKCGSDDFYTRLKPNVGRVPTGKLCKVCTKIKNHNHYHTKVKNT